MYGDIVKDTDVCRQVRRKWSRESGRLAMMVHIESVKVTGLEAFKRIWNKMSCVTWLGRVISRALVTGIQSNVISNCYLVDRFRDFQTLQYFSTDTTTTNDNNNQKVEDQTPVKCQDLPPQISLRSSDMCRALDTRWPGLRIGPGFVSVVSGLPKDFSCSTFRRGQFGDDAWFIARTNNADVIGVADGVGGWRNYGLDPGEFSFSLMKACERLVEAGWFSPSKPGRLLATGFNRIQENNLVQGSSTACVLALSREDSTLYCANLGDSGFVVVRQGKVIHRSEEQTHCFNTPFQLSCPPPGENVLCDSPDCADISQMSVEDGDVILLATDGVFDNVPEQILISELGKVQGEKDPLRLQNAANSIALMARTLAFDTKHMSPFARNAQRNGIATIGGKPDDITVLLATVCMGK
ncbi:unnamed protein product [Allacma fusca]|uniref:Protein phosphatase n=1 Tax=Allacma fusca TaxID=39272 RepID=A0A8J2JQM0_9HEXA|nr:unnamed protein product [Allacma fusca]